MLSELGQHKIRKEIKKLEFENDLTELEKITNNVNQCRESEIAYFEGFSALIEMEEASNSSSIIKFDLPNAKLKLDSRTEKTLRFYHVNI